MDSVYNKKFYEDFCGDNYDDVEHWNAFFGYIARNIVDIFAPKTVLDAGCAYGYLVKALRELGVEAYGFDVSELAISRADESIKPYVAVHSITEKLPSDFPKQFDLVITIEVLEHIFPDEGRKAIKNLCSYSDTVIFTSTPSDLNNKTHVNVQQAEYWAKEFAKNSFYRDPFQSADYICPWAIVFRKKSDIEDVIFNYEINRRVDKIQYDKALDNAAKRQEISGKLYFNCGEWREDNAVAISYSEGENLKNRVSVPHNCTAIRFDPVEGCGCVVNELVIGSSNGILQAQEGNYERSIDRCYYFLTPDPQLYIPLPDGTTWVEVSCVVIVLENIFEQKMISELNAAINCETEKNCALNREYAELESRFNAERQRYEDEKNSLIEKSESRISELESNFNAERQRYEDEKNALAAKNKNDIDGLERDFDTERRQYEDERSALIALIEKREADFAELKKSFDMERRQYERERLALTLKNESELESLTEKIDQSQKTNSDIQAELNSFKKNYNAVIGQRDDITKRFNQSQNNNTKIQAELNHYKAHYNSAIRQRNNLQSEVRYWQDSYNTISSSELWKITKPARSVLDGIKLICRKSKESHLRRVENKRLLKEKKYRDKYGAYNDIKAIAQSYDYLVPQRKAEEERKFTRKIKFSILVPLYNTPKQFLEEMIASVVSQTYPNWELCLADGSDDEHKEVGELVEKLAANDKRIRYKKLKKNLGISENTNACIDMARGDYISLFDHDDVLHPSALFEVMKAICDKDADFIYTDEAVFEEKLDNIKLTHYKPDYSPDTLRGHNYICHFTSFKASLIKQVGKFSSDYDGSQDYDMFLKLTEKAVQIIHIPMVLYFWRSHPMSVASDVSVKPYCVDSAKKALSEHLQRIGLKGNVRDSSAPTTYKIEYVIEDNYPEVSIIIPNKDHKDDLKKCIDSIVLKTTYLHYSIIIVENNSTSEEIFDYYKEITDKYSMIKVVTYKGKFNYSAINNFGAKYADGKYLLLLNNDVEILTHEWLEEMVMFAQRSDVGAVGAKLYYPDNTIQHAGVIVGIGGSAGHAHKHFPRTDGGYIHRLVIAQDLSAVTGACLMTRRDVWDELNGLDESFAVAFNDVDFCLRIRDAGYLIVFTPHAELYHYESVSRGYEDTPEKQNRFWAERTRLRNRWGKIIDAGDPYYNPNLTLDREDFSIK